jgi:hypothetical protein
MNGDQIMKKYLSALLIVGIAIGMSQAVAQTDAASVPKKVTKKAPAKKVIPAAKEEAPLDDEDKPLDTVTSTTTDYQCELGNKITIYHNVDDTKHIALRWQKTLHAMTRVGTTTGANRFENRKLGLVWIGIPAKGMLLDSKLGRQLANECKSAEQLNPKTTTPPETLKISDSVEKPKN